MYIGKVFILQVGNMLKKFEDCQTKHYYDQRKQVWPCVTKMGTRNGECMALYVMVSELYGDARQRVLSPYID